MNYHAQILWIVTGLMAALLLVTACKEEAKNPPTPTAELIIPLQPGLVHIGAQMEGDSLWVESFDQKTNACLLRHYSLDGQMIEGSPKIRLKGCRIQMAAAERPAVAPAVKPKPAATKSTVR